MTTTTEGTPKTSRLSIRGKVAGRAAVLAALPLAATAIIGVTAAPAQAAECNTSSGAVLYEHINYQGACYQLAPDTHGDVGWFNDKASTVHVAAGCGIWTYSDKNRLGLVQVWGDPSGSRADGDNDLRSSIIGNDKISSFSVSCFKPY